VKTAIFGGTFDPIHLAHLTMAREAMNRFGLSRVLFVPAAHPPHKASSTYADYEDRFRMVELACQGEPRFEPSRLEAGEGRSYTIRTIEKVRTGLGPEDELYFLIGADAFDEIQTWHRWKDVMAQVEFIVGTRPGHRYTAPPGAKVHRLDSLALPVSSSELRGRLAQSESPEQIPGSVLRYIRERGLYRENGGDRR
jgi:nicotinate-nucleotide adenylyltransferase